MPPPSTPLAHHDPSTAAATAGRQLGELYARHGRMVLGVCRLVLRDHDEAEDAAQQTFLSAFRAMLEGAAPRDPAAWLGTIARNECRTRLRARERAPLALTENAPTTPDVHSVVSGREDAETVLRALSNLSERQREAVILRSLYGLSYREVAKALGTSVAGVETLLFRGRRRLSEVTRPQLAAAHALLVLPLALRAELAQLVPGFEAGATSGGARAIGVAGGALGIAVAGTAGGGGGSGIAGLLGAPVAARIVGVITAATIGVAAAPTLQGPAGETRSVTAATLPTPGATDFAAGGGGTTTRTGRATSPLGATASPSDGSWQGAVPEAAPHRTVIPEGAPGGVEPPIAQPTGGPAAAMEPAADNRHTGSPRREEEERHTSRHRRGADNDDRADGDSTDATTGEYADGTSRDGDGGSRPSEERLDEPTGTMPSQVTTTTEGTPPPPPAEELTDTTSTTAP